MRPKYKKGEWVELDCGYDGMIDMRECRLIEDSYKVKGLWPDSPERDVARVEILGTGEVFQATLS